MRDLETYSLAYRDLAFEDEIIEYRRKIVMQRLAYYSPNNILEVGCGMKPLFLDLPTDQTITVIEPAPAFFMNAVSMSKDFENVQILNSTLEGANLRAKFDMVIVSCLLHEIEDQTRFLKKLNRLCGRDTVVHFNVPNALSMHRRLSVSMGINQSPYEISNTQHKMQQSNKPFDMTTLEQTLTEHKFIVLDSGGFFIKPLTHLQMSQILQAGIVDETIMGGLFELGKQIPELAAEIWMDCTVV